MASVDDQNTQLSEHWRAQAVGIIRIQTLAAALAGIAAYFVSTGLVSVSVVYGGLLVVINSIMLGRSVSGSMGSQAGEGPKGLYRSAAIRFAGLILVLSLGYAMGLVLPAVAAGMFASYFAGFVFIVSRAFAAKQKIDRG